MTTLRSRTLVAFLAGIALTLIAGFAFQSWRADAAPGDDDTTFVPITPCRLFDTRPAPDRVGPHSTFGDDDTRTIAAHGTNGECTIPTEAVGLSLNITAVGATAPTFLTIWPDGPLPVASSLNPFPGQPPTPNAVATTLSGSGSFDVYNLAGSVNVIADVNGFYTAESLHDLADDIAALEARQPFAVSAFASVGVLLTTTPTDYLTVTVDAPVAGQVTVDSTVAVGHTTDGGDVLCVITTSTAVPPFITSSIESYQKFERGGLSDEGTLSATRTFDISGGSSVDYVLACEEGSDGGRLATRNLTAIFTPAG